MFKPGDKYIHFAKYGSINKGEVASYSNALIIDTKNCVDYSKPYIVTTNNIVLQLDGSDGTIYKVEKEYTHEEANKLSLSLEKIAEYKFNICQEQREGIEL